MLKLDYLVSPQSNNGGFVKNLLMIEYDKDVITTAEWLYGDENINPQESDLKIKHLAIPKKCDILSDKLSEIIKLYELNTKIVETANTRLFFDEYKCNSSEINMEIDSDLISQIDKEK